MAEEQTAEAAPPEVPADLLAEEELQTGLRDLLQSESWDILTLKVVLAKLEQRLPQHPPGTLKPFKKAIKAQIDQMMKSLLAQGGGAPPVPEGAASDPVAPAAPDEPAPNAEAEAGGGETNADKAEVGAEPAKKRRKVVAREEDEEGDEGIEASEPAVAADEDEPRDGVAAQDEEEEEEDDDDDDEEDPDAPRVSGKPTHKSDGKTFYKEMFKGDEKLTVGQDVYLENNQDIPYVARLQEIFVYSFAPTEVAKL